MQLGPHDQEAGLSGHLAYLFVQLYSLLLARLLKAGCEDVHQGHALLYAVRNQYGHNLARHGYSDVVDGLFNVQDAAVVLDAQLLCAGPFFLVYVHVEDLAMLFVEGEMRLQPAVLVVPRSPKYGNVARINPPVKLLQRFRHSQRADHASPLPNDDLGGVREMRLPPRVAGL